MSNIEYGDVKLNFRFRTFQEGDEKGIIKTYMAAFCKSRICEPMTPEFWNWKYGPIRPYYDPEGYQICEYKKKIVGTIQCTLRTMKFNGVQYKVAGIDDVSTCPILEKRGIAGQLMRNAISFMEKREVDLSVLTADPKGHAQRLYERLGYTEKTYISFGAKLISVWGTIKNFTILTPLAIPMRLYGTFKAEKAMLKYKGDAKIRILGKNQEDFRQKLNKNYHTFYSFDDYSPDYWKWYHINRPQSHRSIVVAAKEDGIIKAGGVITKSYLLVVNTKKFNPVFVLTEFFVEKDFRKKGLGSYLLNQLERIARKEGVGIIITLFHGRNMKFRKFLKKMGYLTMDKSVMQMIKPISERAKALFKRNKGKKFVWKVPFEQLGY